MTDIDLYHVAKVSLAKFLPLNSYCLHFPYCGTFSFFLSFFEHLLTCQPLQGALGSSYIFPAPDLESAVFPKSPSSFYWRLVETKTWVLGVLLASGSFLLTEQGNLCIYTRHCFCT